MNDLERFAAHTKAFWHHLSHYPQEGVEMASRWADSHWSEFLDSAVQGTGETGREQFHQYGEESGGGPK